MWDKLYDVAARQYFNGKLKKAEGQAAKALQVALDSNDPKKVARSSELLARVLRQTESPKAAETILIALESNAKAFGEDSIELASILTDQFFLMEKVGDVARAESSLLRAMSILEKKSPPEPYFSRSEMLSNFYLMTNNFEKAESNFLTTLPKLKDFYGPCSNEVKRQIPLFLDILKAQGRSTETAELEKHYAECAACKGERGPHRTSDEIEELVNGLNHPDESVFDESSLAALRDAIHFVEKKYSEGMDALSAGDPFIELKKEAIAEPRMYLRGRLAQQLRLIGEAAKDKAFLVESAQIFRENLAADLVPNLNFTIQLQQSITLLLLALEDKTQFEELESLLNDMCESATPSPPLYMKALMLFARDGSTPDSRAVMEDAIASNVLVPMLIAEGLETFLMLPPLANKSEAFSIAQETSSIWKRVNGAIDFMTVVFSEKLPPKMRKGFLRETAPHTMA